MVLVSQVSADDRESAWRIIRHREIMARLIPLWAVLGVALVLMGVDLGGRLLWTLPMIGSVFGVLAVDHGPDYRASNYWVPVLGSQAARKRVVTGKRVAVRVDLGGRRIIQKKRQEE